MTREEAMEVLKIEFDEGFPCKLICKDSFCEKCVFYNAVKFAFGHLENKKGGDE